MLTNKLKEDEGVNRILATHVSKAYDMRMISQKPNYSPRKYTENFSRTEPNQHVRPTSKADLLRRINMSRQRKPMVKTESDMPENGKDEIMNSNSLLKKYRDATPTMANGNNSKQNLS